MDMYSNRESPPVYKHVIRKVVLFAGDLQKDSGELWMSYRSRF